VHGGIDAQLCEGFAGGHEATSVLDSTSRISVYEALKRWRQGKTTIVITHDLSQIAPKDFVCVLHQGEVVEQGFRADLESTCGVFREMIESQGQTGGFFPEEGEDPAKVEENLGILEEEQTVEEQGPPKHATLRPLTLGNWMFEAIAQLMGQSVPSTDEPTAGQVLSPDLFPEEIDSARMRGPSSVDLTHPPPWQAQMKQRKHSLQFEPATPTVSLYHQQPSPRRIVPRDSLVQDDGLTDEEKMSLARRGAKAVELHGGRKERTRWDEARLTPVSAITTKCKPWQGKTSGQSQP
jgi:ATP-binding cassette, subfamily B (MDR/TAP), member 1